MNFRIHTIGSAPTKTLYKIKQQYGFIPNFLGVMAQSPNLLDAYVHVSKLFEETKLTDVEKLVVLLSASQANHCNYCVAADSATNIQKNNHSEIVESIRQGDPLQDEKLEALRCFTVSVVSTQGSPPHDQITQFLKKGYTQEHILDVILGIGLKTLSNYTNLIAQTPLDFAFSDFKQV